MTARKSVIAAAAGLTLLFSAAAAAPASTAEAAAPTETSTFPAPQELHGESAFKNLIVDADKPVLVEFYASWCGYCKMMKPLVAAAAKTGVDEVATINVEGAGNKGLAARYTDHGAVPTFVLFNHGQPVARQDGAFSSAAALKRFMTPPQ